MNEEFTSVCKENEDGSRTYTMEYATVWYKIRGRSRNIWRALKRFNADPWYCIVSANLRFALWLNGGSVIYRCKLENGEVKMGSKRVYISDIHSISTEAYSAPMLHVGAFDDWDAAENKEV